MQTENVRNQTLLNAMGYNIPPKSAKSESLPVSLFSSPPASDSDLEAHGSVTRINTKMQRKKSYTHSPAEDIQETSQFLEYFQQGLQTTIDAFYTPNTLIFTTHPWEKPNPPDIHNKNEGHPLSGPLAVVDGAVENLEFISYYDKLYLLKAKIHSLEVKKDIMNTDLKETLLQRIDAELEGFHQFRKQEWCRQHRAGLKGSPITNNIVNSCKSKRILAYL
ncbi:hypothetical protein K439DRAFT_1615473 [Ramaria rubella]|nr:hypothetical protein K439DRAFT_1615473 [Ramaria rubella]